MDGGSHWGGHGLGRGGWVGQGWMGWSGVDGVVRGGWGGQGWMGCHMYYLAIAHLLQLWVHSLVVFSKLLVNSWIQYGGPQAK